MIILIENKEGIRGQEKRVKKVSNSDSTWIS